MSEPNSSKKTEKSSVPPSAAKYFQRIAASEDQRKEAEQFKATATAELIKQGVSVVATLAEFGLKYQFRELKRAPRKPKSKPATPAPAPAVQLPPTEPQTKS